MKTRMLLARSGLVLIIIFMMFSLLNGSFMPVAEAGGPTSITLVATASGNNVNLSWNSPTSASGLTGYFVYRSTTSGGHSTTPIRDFPVIQTSYTDSSLSNGTYYYIIKPIYNNSTTGAPSNEARVVVGPGSSQTSGVIIVFQVGSTAMLVNGAPQTIDAPPEIVNGRTFVPLSALVAPLGGQVNYIPENQQVTIQLGAASIDLWIGNTSALVNGQTMTMDVPPYISNGRTMLPLGFVTQNLGCQVEWNGATLQVTIRYGTVSAAQINSVNFSGTWEMTRDGEPGYRLVLSQNGNVVTGYQGSNLESGHDFRGQISGSTLDGWFLPDQEDYKWQFRVTMAYGGQSFDGLEYYSDSPFNIHGQKAGANTPANLTVDTRPPVEKPSNEPDDVQPFPGTNEATANFSGTWNCVENGESGYTMILTQSNNQVTGRWGDDGWMVSGTVTGNVLYGQFYKNDDPNSTTSFTVTIASNGQSFNGLEYYSNPPWPLSGTKSST